MSSYSTTYTRRDKRKTREDAGFWTVRLPRYTVRTHVNTVYALDDLDDSQIVYAREELEPDDVVYDRFNVYDSGGSGGSAANSGRSTYAHRNRDRKPPRKIHRFYEKARDQTPPSWFFSNCSRELAEIILQKGQDFGNTLMRESTSHMQSGSYVVSKAVWDSRKGRCTYEHYEVMQVAQGYQLNVENEHKPMLYLSEVMAYFVKTTGGSSMPMSTNDLRQLGVDRQADYDRILRPPGEPWVWPPPDYDYDDVAVPPQQHRQVEPSKRAQTLTPRSSEKKVGFVPKTMATRPKSQQPQMPELAGRVQEANQLDELNKIINKYDQQSSTTSQPPVHSVSGVETVKPFKSPSISTIPAPPPPPPPPQSAPPRLTSPKATPLVTATPVTSLSPATNLSSATSTIPPAPVAPLPPTPHKVSHQPPYVNEGADDRLIDILPVAPPPPRVPLVNGPSSHNPSSSRQSSMTSAAPTFITNLQKTPQSTGARPVSSINIGQNSPGSAGSVPSWLKQNKSSQPVNLTSSPGKLPTWSKPVTSAMKIDNAANNGAESSGNSSVVEAGVDDKNPGGVNNLRSKFEQQLSLNVVPTVNVVQKKPGVKKVTIQEPEKFKTGPNNVDHHQLRRQSEPAISMFTRSESASTETAMADGATNKHVEGLNPEFKNKLEGLFGGSSTGTTPLSPKGPASRSHTSHYENVYEELPDDGLIVPDAVTYVNDKHNA